MKTTWTSGPWQFALVLALNLIFGIGCAKKGSEGSGEAQIGAGYFTQTLEEIYKGEPYFCDLEQKNFRFEIATTLDSKESEITEYLDSDTEARFKKIPFGPIHIYERIDQPPAAGTQNKLISWNQAYDLYKKASQFQKIQDWAILYELVAELMVRDHDRVALYDNLYLDSGDDEILRSLQKNIENCKSRLCLTVELSPAETKLVDKAYWYVRAFKKIRSPSTDFDPESRAKLIEKVLIWIKNDLSSFEFRKNFSIERRSENTFVVPLNAGVFEGQKDLLSLYIERVWKSPEYKILVDWSAESPLAFGFQPTLFPQQTSQVLFSKGIVRLSTGFTTVGTIAHEFGHVLGFKDEYFYVWSDKECGYNVKADIKNLMADNRGRPLPKHWEKLNEAYPFKK